RHLARLLTARHPSEVRVVEDNRLARRARPHVELDRLRAFFDRARERLEGVLSGPPLPSPAAMPDNDRAAFSRERAHVVSSSAICFARARVSSILSTCVEMAPTTGCPPPP